MLQEAEQRCHSLEQTSLRAQPRRTLPRRHSRPAHPGSTAVVLIGDIAWIVPAWSRPSGFAVGQTAYLVFGIPLLACGPLTPPPRCAACLHPPVQFGDTWPPHRACGMAWASKVAQSTMPRLGGRPLDEHLTRRLTPRTRAGNLDRCHRYAGDISRWRGTSTLEQHPAAGWRRFGAGDGSTRCRQGGKAVEVSPLDDQLSLR